MCFFMLIKKSYVLVNYFIFKRIGILFVWLKNMIKGFDLNRILYWKCVFLYDSLRIFK